MSFILISSSSSLKLTLGYSLETIFYVFDFSQNSLNPGALLLHTLPTSYPGREQKEMPNQNEKLLLLRMRHKKEIFI